MNNIFLVTWQGEYEAPMPWEDGKEPSCEIRLREFGEAVFRDEYICVLKDNLAKCKFHRGDLVVAALRFKVRQRIDGSCYQEIQVVDIKKIK